MKWKEYDEEREPQVVAKRSSCPGSLSAVRPCLTRERRIAARGLFTNPSSTRLPELPLGCARFVLPALHHGLLVSPSWSLQSLPLFHALHGVPGIPTIALRRGASGPALVTVRREHPSSPTPRPLLVSIISRYLSLPLTLFSSKKYSNISPTSFRLRPFSQKDAPRGGGSQPRP